jgi:hypothetical protein
LFTSDDVTNRYTPPRHGSRPVQPCQIAAPKRLSMQENTPCAN